MQQNPDPLDGNAFRYAGQYYDTESGTYYLRTRYYNPATGRFTQQDAWKNANRGDPLGLNLYPVLSGFPHSFPETHKPCLKFLQAGLVILLCYQKQRIQWDMLLDVSTSLYPGRGAACIFCVIYVLVQIKVFNRSVKPDFGCK